MAATYTTWGGRVDTVSGSGYHKRAYASGQAQDSSPGTTVKGFLSRRMDRNKDTTDTQNSQDIVLEPLSVRRNKESQGWKEIGNALENKPSNRHPSTTTKDSHDDYIGKDSTGNLVQEDQQSSGSHDSQKMIIRRDLEWSVRYEHRSDANGDDPGLPRGHNTRRY